MKKQNLFIFGFILFIFGCNVENINNDQINGEKFILKQTENSVTVVSLRKFKTADFIISENIDSSLIDTKEHKISIKNKEIITKITVKNSKKFIEKDEVIFIVNKNGDYKISLKENWFLTKFFEKSLFKIYIFIGNFGLAIIFFTLLIKLILLPLNLKQDKSMRDMKKIQPDVEKLKEKYKENPQELNKKTMELYKKYNVNPFGGCFPAIAQLPILWTLFRVLRTDSINSIVPQNASFLIWDLASTDKLFILPILNGLVAFIQQRIMSGDSSMQSDQMKMMAYFMPVMILFISLQMPSGLQLYWLTSSLISLIQQYYIMKKRG